MGITNVAEAEGGGPQRIDRYDLVGEIATGGMATVYLARLTGMGGFQRNAAVKLLHPHLARNAEFVEMFFDEARLAASIHHPNVVPILEVGEGAQGYYLVMEYIEGDTFASLLSGAATRGRRVPLRVALRIVVDMLAGLHAAHELRDARGVPLGLVHRDVSPQNILVGTDGVTRISDFGVARAASRLSETRAGQLKGKLAYMAPEQVQGEEEVDRRADVFSAGVVLWEALSLSRLFRAANEAATLTRVLTEPIVSPREKNQEVPERVAKVCLKALARDPNRRYVSCAAFADALEKAAAESNLLATPREVATYVAEMVGDEVESHRRAIREWLERQERSGATQRMSTPPPPLRAASAGAPPKPSGRVPKQEPVSQHPSRDSTVPEGLTPPPPPPGSWGEGFNPPPPPPGSWEEGFTPPPPPPGSWELEPAPQARDTSLLLGAASAKLPERPAVGPRFWIFAGAMVLGLGLVMTFASPEGVMPSDTPSPRSTAASAVSLPEKRSEPSPQPRASAAELGPAPTATSPAVIKAPAVIPRASGPTRRARPQRRPAGVRSAPAATDLENPYQ